ncbi:hypothetical protein DRN86_01690 [Candidatus Geothermarchaeota archaeon]|mgnify:CR=1 FL=1|nr:MAG: hypothetical protein DRN86_01690 [Candidatus Geothermarchaeota archaeon]
MSKVVEFTIMNSISVLFIILTTIAAIIHIYDFNRDLRSKILEAMANLSEMEEIAKRENITIRIEVKDELEVVLLDKYLDIRGPYVNEVMVGCYG